MAARPARVDGYAELRDYAVIGDGRCAALIARDGSVDWLAWPDLDSPTLFAAVLDPVRGGRFLLQPDVPCTAARRYLPGTNVLETTFTTAGGTVRVTDALTMATAHALAPGREVVRRIEGLAGSVPMRWSVQPRFGYGAHAPRLTRRAGVPVVASGPEAVAVCAWDAGEPQHSSDAVASRFRAEAGTRALLALPYAYQEPLVLPTRGGAAQRPRPQALGLRPLRRGRRRRDLLTARGTRRGTQLGLPLQLDPRLRLHPERLPQAGLRAGSDQQGHPALP
jgi:hypothetical protein